MGEEEHLENCNVYVGGLHPDVDQAMLRKKFRHLGDIKQIRIDWRQKGYGFIHYATHEQARECIEDMDGRLILGQPIKCRWAQNKKKQQERERERELAEKNGTLNDPTDPNAVTLNGVDLNVADDINMNHPQPIRQQQQQQQRVLTGMGDTESFYNNNNKKKSEMNITTVSGDNSASSSGFLSMATKRKPKRKSPPALENNEGKKQDTSHI